MTGKDDITVTFTEQEIRKIKEAVDLIVNKIESKIPAQCNWHNPKRRPPLR
jgi:hypothetical protein